MIFISSCFVVLSPILHCNLKVNDEVVWDLVILMFWYFNLTKMIQILQLLKTMRKRIWFLVYFHVQNRVLIVWFLLGLVWFYASLLDFEWQRNFRAFWKFRKYVGRIFLKLFCELMSCWNKLIFYTPISF